MAKEPKLNPSDVRRLRREAERLIAAGEMPSLQQVLEAVAEARKKYADQIRAARAEGGDNSEQ
jgi:vacuolar-type H+-ATPase subunit H